MPHGISTFTVFALNHWFYFLSQTDIQLTRLSDTIYTSKFLKSIFSEFKKYSYIDDGDDCINGNDVNTTSPSIHTNQRSKEWFLTLKSKTMKMKRNYYIGIINDLCHPCSNESPGRVLWRFHLITGTHKQRKIVKDS